MHGSVLYFCVDGGIFRPCLFIKRKSTSEVSDMRCKNCGAENDDSRYICEVCGSPLYDENELSAQADQQPAGTTPGGAPAPAPRPNPEEDKKLQQKNKQSMIIIIVLCVVLIAVVVLSLIHI